MKRREVNRGTDCELPMILWTRYSNDMWPNHPENPEAWGDLPTFEGEAIVGYNTDQSRFTSDFTARAVEFIESRAEAGAPFFL